MKTAVQIKKILFLYKLRLLTARTLLVANITSSPFSSKHSSQKRFNMKFCLMNLNEKKNVYHKP